MEKGKENEKNPIKKTNARDGGATKEVVLIREPQKGQLGGLRSRHLVRSQSPPHVGLWMHPPIFFNIFHTSFQLFRWFFFQVFFAFRVSSFLRFFGQKYFRKENSEKFGNEINMFSFFPQEE